MRKPLLFIMSLFAVLVFTLSACSLISTPDRNQEEDIVNTLVAMAFTQTAMVQPTSEPESDIVNPTPSPELASEETTASEEIIHALIPGEPGWINKWFYDTDASQTAGGGYVNGGDDFIANRWERPFTETEMVYRPDLDIYKTEMSEDNNFYYVMIYLHAVHPDGGLPGIYGIEIDIDRDGRGDLLVTAQNPSSSTWDIAGVSVYKDANNDVGGSSIMRPDSGYAGDGYETVLFSAEVLVDPDAAWARANLGSSSVTLAFKKSLLGSSTFVWGVWAAESLLNPAMLDLHDHFTQAEAGVPYQAQATYPIKAINLVDNTCRETYGFDATLPIPGLCQLPEPTPKPATATPKNGTLTIWVFVDKYPYNQIYDGAEVLYGGSFTLTFHRDSCSNPEFDSTTSSITVKELEAGTYCIKITPLSDSVYPGNIIIVPGGVNIDIYFGFEERI